MMAMQFGKEPQMTVFRAIVFLILAAGVFGAGTFIGGTIAQPALLQVLPWYQVSGQKI